MSTWSNGWNEHNTFEPAANLAHAKEEVQEYWQQQLLESRLVVTSPHAEHEHASEPYISLPATRFIYKHMYTPGICGSQILRRPLVHAKQACASGSAKLVARVSMYLVGFTGHTLHNLWRTEHAC